MNKLGLIAGGGELPIKVVEYCKNNNVELFCVLIENFADIDKYKENKSIEITFGQVGKAINFFKKNNVDNIVFAGNVKKPSFGFMRVDFKGFLLLKQLLKNKILGDNTVLETVINFLSKYGLNILELDSFLDNIKLSRGNNSKIDATNYIDSINYGAEILKILSKFDIGQSIVIQQKNVIGIEAVEGTENLIKRCADIKYKNGDKPILVKIKKDNQTRKIDLPTIGPDTIEQLYEAGFAGIAFDSKNCIILSVEKVIDLANKYSLFLYGI